jgi:alpha-galactosidase
MSILLGLLLTLLVSPVYGVLKRTWTPQMGWNTFNAYGCNINEEQVKMNAQALVDSGLRDFPERDAQGKMQWNSTTFPSGGKALGDFLHERNLGFGMYSGAGFKQCNPCPIVGSRGQTFLCSAPIVGCKTRRECET